VALIGTKSNRDGLGATISVHIGEKKFSQFNDGKSGYLAQSRGPLYFGLGTAVKADAVEVLWPSGKRQVVTEDLPVNGLVRIRETAE
jgi:hypothetical protein